jgi:hypothetical protein
VRDDWHVQSCTVTCPCHEGGLPLSLRGRVDHWLPQSSLPLFAFASSSIIHRSCRRGLVGSSIIRCALYRLPFRLYILWPELLSNVPSWVHKFLNLVEGTHTRCR